MSAGGASSQSQLCDMTDHFPGHCAVTHLNVPVLKNKEMELS